MVMLNAVAQLMKLLIKKEEINAKLLVNVVELGHVTVLEIA